jgi:hypothetical protein
MPKELADLRPYHRSDVDWPLIVYQTIEPQRKKFGPSGFHLLED